MSSSHHGSLQDEANNDAQQLASPCSSPRDPDAEERFERFMAALQDAVEQYRRGDEDGPYALMGEFSQAEFEELDARSETRWRLGYDKRTRQIVVYGDATFPHEVTRSSLWDAVRAEFELFCRQLETTDTNFNRASPFSRVKTIMHGDGAVSRNLGEKIKQADESLVLEGVNSSRIALAIEVAFKNESSATAAEETLDWVVNGQAEFALTVKIKKNPANQNDPFITVFFCDCNESRSYTTGTHSGTAPATRQVIHEWPCGSGSAIAPQGFTHVFDRLNLETATSPLTSNPAVVRYSVNFDAEVVFHGEGDPTNILQIPLGRSWAAHPRAPSDVLNFVDEDWDQLQDFVVNLNLGELRGDIVVYMLKWIQAGCRS